MNTLEKQPSQPGICCMCTGVLGSTIFLATFLAGAPFVPRIAWAKVVPAASAQEAKRHEAAALFRQGVKAHREGDFERAARIFGQAHRAFPSAAALYNSARAWQEAERPARAADAYAEVVELSGIDDVRAQDAASQLALLRLSLATVRIEADQPGAVTVAHIEHAPVPIVFHLAAGRHLLKFHAAKTDARAEAILDIKAGVPSFYRFGLSSSNSAAGRGASTAPQSKEAGEDQGTRDREMFFVAGISLGVAALFDQSKGSVADLDVTRNIDGGAGTFLLNAGVSLTPELILSLRVGVDSIKDPKIYSSRGGQSDDIGGAVAVLWGAEFDYAPSGADGWFATAAVGAANFQLKNRSGAELRSDSPAGGFVSLSAGKRWWLADTWMFGLALRGSVAKMGANAFDHNLTSIGLAAQTLWNRRGR